MVVVQDLNISPDSILYVDECYANCVTILRISVSRIIIYAIK